MSACSTACAFCGRCSEFWERDEDARDEEQVVPQSPAAHDDEQIRQRVNRAARSPLSNFLFDELVSAARRAS